MRCFAFLCAPVAIPILPALALSLPPLGRRATTIDKPAIKPPFSEAKQEKDLQKDLPLSSWRYELWDPDWLPQACVTEAEHIGFDPAHFEAVEVWYGDCAAPWTVCRHIRADESWYYILNTLGKVPVGLRQYISTAVIMGRTTHANGTAPTRLPFAYSRPKSGVLTFMPSYFKLGVIFHETAHILDYLSPSVPRPPQPPTPLHFPTTTTTINTTSPFHAPPKITPFSQSPLWQTALAKTRSLPTPYARTNPAEAFADTVRWTPGVEGV